jgi:eukaryotic-like serine/threonine-protein kinase
MNLSKGTRLGPYEILDPLGAGGMGEVYRARDTRLDRIVAIKVLPAHLSSNTEARQRFEREAKTVSSLSHPHICALYDIGHQDGIDYLVMEYLEGKTLADQLAKGPLSLDQVLRHAMQIADALDKAHRVGIVHRDLKPGNIMLTKAGAKLLDLGLAKWRDQDGGALLSGQTAVPTAGRNLTAEGTILGTLQYMAPEQLEGREADPRTDIFAFGAVLYEMATGKKAFIGKSLASLIGAILRDESPPISSLQPMTPPALDRVVKTAMAKDPDERWQTAHDVLLELKWISEGSSQVTVAMPEAARRKSRERLAWIAASTFFLVSLVSLLLTIAHLRHEPADTRVIKLSLPPPEKASFGSLSISPDGHWLAFTAAVGGKEQLWVRPLDALTAQALPGTEGATFPFWSPDSRFIGFFAGGKLKKIETSGGLVQTVCDAGAGAGGTWNREGVIVFAVQSFGLFQVSATRGDVTPVTTIDFAGQEGPHHSPSFLPDGRHFLYYIHSWRKETRGIYLGSLDQPMKQRLLGAESNAVYAQPDFLIFAREGALLAQPFDAQ